MTSRRTLIAARRQGSPARFQQAREHLPAQDPGAWRARSGASHQERASTDRSLDGGAGELPASYSARLTELKYGIHLGRTRVALAICSRMSSIGGHCKSCGAHQTGVLPKPGAYDWHALEGLHGIAPNDSAGGLWHSSVLQGDVLVPVGKNIGIERVSGQNDIRTETDPVHGFVCRFTTVLLRSLSEQRSRARWSCRGEKSRESLSKLLF